MVPTGIEAVGMSWCPKATPRQAHMCVSLEGTWRIRETGTSSGSVSVLSDASGRVRVPGMVEGVEESAEEQGRPGGLAVAYVLVPTGIAAVGIS